MIGEGEFRKRLGETLVIISQHNTSCEKCKPFERKVLIDDVYSGGSAEDGDYMLLSQAMAAGLFHPRCRHGLGTYYPELEDINGYETTDNRLNEYGDEELNRAHIENMVQRYRRLSEGSLDPDNIAKHQAKLSEWEERKDKAVAKDFGKGSLPFNEKALFKAEIPVYTSELNSKISMLCKQLAKKGSLSGNENLCLVDKDNGEVICFEEGNSESVGGEDFRNFIQSNKHRKFVFIHTHPSGEMLSMQDLNTFFSGDCYDSMIAVGHNGKIYIAYGKKKKLTKGMALTETFVYDDILSKDLRMLLKSGTITPSEYARELEAKRVDFLLENYCEHIEVET